MLRPTYFKVLIAVWGALAQCSSAVWCSTNTVSEQHAREPTTKKLEQLPDLPALELKKQFYSRAFIIRADNPNGKGREVEIFTSDGRWYRQLIDENTSSGIRKWFILNQYICIKDDRRGTLCRTVKYFEGNYYSRLIYQPGGMFHVLDF